MGKRRGMIDDNMVGKALAEGLIRAARKGKTETCKLCGAKVISVALHYLSCPIVLSGSESEKPK